MSALLIIQASVTRREGYKAYQAAVQPLIASFGGTLKGTKIKEFWNSSAYAKVKLLRAGAAKVDIWAVPGC